jgi:hypothetical protein
VEGIFAATSKNFAGFSSKIGTSWSKIALTNIYCSVSHPPRALRRLVMDPQKDKSPLPPSSLSAGLLPAIPAAANASATYATSDCLYQFAALTAGAFLLATML